MPKEVNSNKFTVHGKDESVNHEPSTLNLPGKHPAFTLIELLVALSIIAVLASIAFLAFNNGKEKSLDKTRKQDIMSLKQALTSAKFDEGFYKSDLTDGSLVPKYIDKIPQDPKLGSVDYVYAPAPIGCDNTPTNYCTSFTLIACLDNAKDTQKDSSTAAQCQTDPYNTTSSYTQTSQN